MADAPAPVTAPDISTGAAQVSGPVQPTAQEQPEPQQHQSGDFDIIATLVNKGFKLPDAVQMYNEKKAADTRNSNDFNIQRLKDEDDLTAKFQTNGNPVQSYQDIQTLAKQRGYDDAWQNKMVSSARQGYQQYLDDQESQVNIKSAIANNQVKVLDSDDRQKAFQLIRAQNGSDVSTALQNHSYDQDAAQAKQSPQQYAQTQMKQKTWDAEIANQVVDPTTASAMQNSLHGFMYGKPEDLMDKTGQYTPVAQQMMDSVGDYYYLAKKGGVGFADEHIQDPQVKAFMNEVMAHDPTMSDPHGSVQYVMRSRNMPEGTKADTAPNQDQLKAAVTDATPNLASGMLGQLVGRMGSYYSGMPDMVKGIVNNSQFIAQLSVMAQHQAADNAVNNVPMTPEGIAQGVTVQALREGAVVGDTYLLPTKSTGKSVAEQMGLDKFNNPMAVNDAIMNFLHDNKDSLEKSGIFPNMVIKNTPQVSGFGIPGLAQYRTDHMPVQNMSYSIDGNGHLFISQRPTKPGELPGIAHSFDLKQIGDEYMQKMATGSANSWANKANVAIKNFVGTVNDKLYKAVGSPRQGEPDLIPPEVYKATNKFIEGENPLTQK